MTPAALARLCASIRFRGGLARLHPEVQADGLRATVAIWVPRIGRRRWKTDRVIDGQRCGPLLSRVTVLADSTQRDALEIIRHGFERLLVHELGEALVVRGRAPFNPHRSAE